jgi:hypothetical protein
MADDVFIDFDMVVAISQSEINAQLRQLATAGSIPTQMFVGQSTDASGQYVYTTYASADAVPKDAPFVAGTFVPQIRIAATGTVINLVLAFDGGSAAFAEAWGPLGLKTYELNGWVYEVPVNLDLAAIAAGDLENVPADVQLQLSAFTPTMFQVSSLFMDFDATNLLSWTPTSAAPGGPADGLTWLAVFMQFYLRDRVKDHNPFILGYTASAKSAQQANPNVPALLQPTGTTFTLYQDPADADRSTLNFVLVTAGGHVAIPGSAPYLRASMLAGDASATAVYSHSILAEPMLVKPVFDQIRDGVYAQIKDKVGAPPGHDYASAKIPHQGGGWDFAISNQGGGDTYRNNFTAAIQPPGGTISFSGAVNVYEQNWTHMGACTASAWGWANVGWSGEVTLTAGGDGLAVSSGFSTGSVDAGTDTNSCADFFDWLGVIFGGMFDGLTGFLDGGFFQHLFSGAVTVPDIGEITVAIGTVGSLAQTGIVLPTGQVFTPRQPDFDADGNVIVPMAYSSTSTGGTDEEHRSLQRL